VILISMSYCIKLFQWLIDEAAAKHKAFDKDEWKFVARQDEKAPLQTNSYDCGMFVIACIDSLVNNLPIEESSYSQVDMPELRLKLIKSICQGNLH